MNTDQPRKLLKLFTTYQFLDAQPELTVGGGLYWEGGNCMAVTNPVTNAPERLTQDAYTLVKSNGWLYVQPTPVGSDERR